MLGTFTISMYSFNNDRELREKVLTLLTNGHCYNVDGSFNYDNRLVMEVVNHTDENGVMSETQYDVVVREAESFH